MKKILVILSSLTLIGASASSIMSFRTISTNNDKVWLNELSSAKIETYDNDFQIINQLSISLDLDNLNTTKQNIESRVRQAINSLQIQVVQGVDYEIQGIQYNGQGRPIYGGRFLVSALPTSKLIRGEFYLHLQKRFDFDYPVVGSKEDGEAIKNQIIAEIKRWIPSAILGRDFTFVDLGDEAWVFQAINSDIKGNFAYFYEQVGLENINDLKLTVDVDKITKNTLEDQVNQLIKTKVNNVQLGIDYQIESIPYDSNGRPTQAGVFKVSALPNSSLITGSFDLHLQKKLTFNYPTTGNKMIGDTIKNQIIAEIRRWNPNAAENIDYQIIKINNSGSWQIVSALNADVIVNFSFRVQLIDISNLSLIIDIDQTNKTDIENQINRLISSIASGAKLDVDYTIANIVYDSNNRPIQVGNIKISALPNSMLFGNFILRLQKTLILDYPNVGSNTLGQSIKKQIIDEILKWNPNAIQGADYQIIETKNSWTIRSTDNANVILNFTFSSELIDISQLPLLTFELINGQTTKTVIENEVEQSINNIARGAKLGIDYQIGEIRYNKLQNPTNVGKIKISAINTSKLITGSFNIRLKTTLDFSFLQSRGSRRIGDTNKNNILYIISSWNPYAIRGIDYELIETRNSWTIRSLPGADVIVSFTYTIL